MKVHPVQAELFHEDIRAQGQTNMIKLIVTFHNFAMCLKTDHQICKCYKQHLP